MILPKKNRPRPAKSPLEIYKPLQPIQSSVSLPRRWRSLKRMGNLILPRPTILPIDLSRDLEVLAALQEARANDNLVAQYGLVVVYMGGAIGTVVAVDRFSCYRI